jgi:hypothetical protein
MPRWPKKSWRPAGQTSMDARKGGTGMRTRGRLLAVTLVVGVVASLALAWLTPASAQVVVYDDFNDPSNLVRADKWQAFDFWNFDGGPLDRFQFIDTLLFPTENPKLMIAKRVHIPLIAADVLALEYSGYFAAGGSATAAQAKVTLVACTPTAGVVTFAGVNMRGFHDNTPPDGALGDIFGGIQVRCLETGSPQLFWIVQRCDNASCAGISSELGSGVLGPASLGQGHTLLIENLGNRFRFTADGSFFQEFVPPGALSASPNAPGVAIFSGVAAFSAGAGGDLAVVGTFDDVMRAP